MNQDSKQSEQDWLDDILEYLSQAQWQLGHDALIPLTKNVLEAKQAILTHLEAAKREAEAKGRVNGLSAAHGFVTMYHKTSDILILINEDMRKAKSDLSPNKKEPTHGE